MLLGLRSRRPCSEPGRTRIESTPHLRSDFTRDAATHRWTGASPARPGTCDQPGSAVGTRVLQTQRNPEAAGRSREALKTAGLLTVRLTPAPSHNLHRLGDHSLQKHKERESWNGSEAAADIWLRSMFEAHHFLKVDQFLQVVWVSLIDERHVLEETTERTSVRMNLTPTCTILGHFCHL